MVQVSYLFPPYTNQSFVVSTQHIRVLIISYILLMKVDICKPYFSSFLLKFNLFQMFIHIISFFLLFSHFFLLSSHEFLAIQPAHPPSQPFSLLILSFFSFLACTHPKNKTITIKTIITYFIFILQSGFT